MPPRKKAEPKVLPKFPPATSEFTMNSGFRYGLSDNPPELGTKTIPLGKPGCLQGITFVATGTMPSLTRDQLKGLIEQYGGRMTGSISGKTDVVIRGCLEVGPKKLSDAQAKGITIIDEDGLLQVIAESNPDWKPASTKEEFKPESTPETEELVPPALKEESSSSTPSICIGNDLLTEKYRPQGMDQFVGNAAAIKRLSGFLTEFKPGSDQNCAILSGPPGIGKSTAASILAKLAGYRVQEWNASDTRSKGALKEKSDVFTNKSLSGLSIDQKTCLIFDEVDGMSSGDRGGLQQLVQLIKTTKNPIICICNDRNSKKLQTLANYGLDIQFRQPQITDIFNRLKYIAKQENIPISDPQLNAIAQHSHGDIRHAINTLQFWSLHDDYSQTGSDIVLDDVVSSTQKLFMKGGNVTTKLECFFVDYGITPLYAYENLPCKDRNGYAESLELMACGDCIDATLRSEQAWNLLPGYGICSCVGPAFASQGQVMSVRFPQWFGKMSRQKKLSRYCREISMRSKHEDIPDSFAPLISMATKKLAQEGDAEAIIDLLDSLNLTSADYEHIHELVYFDDGPKTAAKFLPGSAAVKRKINAEYKGRHGDVQTGKIQDESSIRSDYLIRDLRKKTRGKSKKGDVEDEYEITRTQEESEDEDDDFETEEDRKFIVPDDTY